MPPRESGLIVPGDAKSLTTTDLNGDGRPDFVVGVNDDNLAVFEQTGASASALASIRLKGKKGNLSAVGSRVRVTLDDGSTQTAEVAAGDGYLSQSGAVLTFGLGSGRKVTEVEVRWPDGSRSHTTDPDTSSLLVIPWTR